MLTHDVTTRTYVRSGSTNLQSSGSIESPPQRRRRQGAGGGIPTTCTIV